MSDEELMALCARVNPLVLDKEPETFKLLSDLAQEGNEQARYCLRINYNPIDLATQFGFEWAYGDVVENPWSYYSSGQEFLEFLFECAEKGITATQQQFDAFEEDELNLILTCISPKYIYASKSIAQHFDILPEDKRKQAFPYVQVAMEQGFEEAFEPMAFCMIEGFCTDFNLEGAKELHAKAIEANKCMDSLKIQEKIEAKEKEINEVLTLASASTDRGKAHALYEEAAEKGSQIAKNHLDANYYYELAMAYKNGQGVEKSAKNAYECFKKAARQEHVPALFEMGVCIAEGKSTYKNWEKGLSVIQQAAENGNEEAQTYIAEKDKFWNKIKRAF